MGITRTLPYRIHDCLGAIVNNIFGDTGSSTQIGNSGLKMGTSVSVNTNFQYLKGNVMKLDREARIEEDY